MRKIRPPIGQDSPGRILMAVPTNLGVVVPDVHALVHVRHPHALGALAAVTVARLGTVEQHAVPAHHHTDDNT
jgi:hypothetical protein